MSRTMVHRLLALAEPPRYARGAGGGSRLEAFAEPIAAMLAEDARVPATMTAQRLRLPGSPGR